MELVKARKASCTATFLVSLSTKALIVAAATAAILGLQIRSANAQEAAVNVIQVTSDADKTLITDIQLVVDENNDLVGLGVTNNKNESRKYSLEQLKAGADILETSGHKVVAIRTGDVDPREGGVATLDYLYSGTNGKRKEFGLEIHKVGSTWSAFTGADAGKIPFTKMFLKKNTLLGITVGIKTVTVQ